MKFNDGWVWWHKYSNNIQSDDIDIAVEVHVLKVIEAWSVLVIYILFSFPYRPNNKILVLIDWSLLLLKTKNFPTLTEIKYFPKMVNCLYLRAHKMVRNELCSYPILIGQKSKPIVYSWVSCWMRMLMYLAYCFVDFNRL